jgi:thymidine kinase
MNSFETFFPSTLRDPGRGQAFLYLGSMFSGKTNIMLNTLDRYDYVRPSVQVVLFKYHKDTREKDGAVRSRNGTSRQPTSTVSTGEELWDKVLNAAVDGKCATLVVGIDEAHFIRKLDYFVERVLDHRTELPTTTILLYMAALDSSFARKMWPAIVDVLPLCNGVRKLTAICGTCQQREAQLSRRDVDSAELELIGSKESYTATCFVCHNFRTT